MLIGIVRDQLQAEGGSKSPSTNNDRGLSILNSLLQPRLTQRLLQKVLSEDVGIRGSSRL